MFSCNFASLLLRCAADHRTWHMWHTRLNCCQTNYHIGHFHSSPYFVMINNYQYLGKYCRCQLVQMQKINRRSEWSIDCRTSTCSWSRKKMIDLVHCRDDPHKDSTDVHCDVRVLFHFRFVRMPIETTSKWETECNISASTLFSHRWNAVNIHSSIVFALVKSFLFFFHHIVRW
jgi:hypothetical protein